MADCSRSEKVLFQQKGNIRADSFGRAAMCALGNERHGSNPIEVQARGNLFEPRGGAVAQEAAAAAFLPGSRLECGAG